VQTALTFDSLFINLIDESPAYPAQSQLRLRHALPALANPRRRASQTVLGQDSRLINRTATQIAEAAHRG
jgi:hypothetical protein